MAEGKERGSPKRVVMGFSPINIAWNLKLTNLFILANPDIHKTEESRWQRAELMSPASGEGYVACVEHVVRTEVNARHKDGVVCCCPSNIAFPLFSADLFIGTVIHSHLPIRQEINA